jgi:hypothetical protein
VTTFVLLVVATSNHSRMLTIARARHGVRSLQQSLKEGFNPNLIRHSVFGPVCSGSDDD